jgi:CheY-like chemotaxis protein
MNLCSTTTISGISSTGIMMVTSRNGRAPSAYNAKCRAARAGTGHATLACILHTHWGLGAKAFTRDLSSDVSVLVVEDDPALRRLVATAVASCGLPVREAENGIAALALISEQVPDLIVLDLQLPEMDGREFLRQVRSTARYADIPIVVTSAAYNLTSQTLQELDVQAFLAKPFDLDELLDIIEQSSPRTVLSPLA